ncbi:MAG: hypothetical protein HRT35_21235 [Algicola sp.]|nr:hypothetical protein [Algicola sp.]
MVEYQVTKYQEISLSLLALADRKRQLELYDEALMYYLEAENFAQKRNDKSTLGISRLKRAAIHIELKQYPQAQVLINQVEQMNQFDTVDLANPLMFIQAKLSYSKGDVTQAVGLITQLEQAYIEVQEKNIYYRMVRWVYQPEGVAMVMIEQDMAVLEALVVEHQLMNIEIYSYALLHYAKWLASQKDSRAEAAIIKAIEHFSQLELTSKIRDCYQIGADYYRLMGQREKADYFQLQADGLTLSSRPLSKRYALKVKRSHFFMLPAKKI